MATLGMSLARSFGRALGCELVVEVSDHSIKTTMERPTTDKRAWDDTLWQRGQLYLKGYANPVKPSVSDDDVFSDHDGVRLIQGVEGDEEASKSVMAKLIPSTRYRQYLDQHLIAELVRPEKQWKLLIYGMIGLGGLSFLNMIITLYATGGF